MTDQASTSRHAVAEFFRALADRDVSIAAAVLADDVVESIPLARSGSSEPEQVFEGKAAVLAYLQTIVDNFDNAQLTDQEIFVSEDGATVFLEAKGALTVRHNGVYYSNTYVFRFSLAGGLITEVREYANPVTFGKAMGLPVG